MNHLILYCRPGFESETAAEISDKANGIDVYGYAKAEEGQGYVSYICSEPGGAVKLMERFSF
ncbi:MAG: 23S rRNA (cytidine(2498)-2'-O)-methyltransferase RlmM, partial [Motiliproteus sp.]|nr:23S rRNA (cytidine(2498)-2'-O)-methyltransferase RlmM [Motiliproteus sp.]